MIDLIALLWLFLTDQPAVGYLGLVSWHLLAVLLVLGVLSAYGLHFLIGYVFGFYRRKERIARWLAWPTLAVFLVSVLALLAAYLLGGRAGPLVHANLTEGVTAELGKMLLEPAFQNPSLAMQPADAVSKGAIKDALRSASELDYRSVLATKLVPPSQLAGKADAPAEPRGPDVLVQVGLRLVTASHGWFDSMSRGPKGGGSSEPFFLPGFLAGLVDELPEGTVLPRLDWEHVAGTRFVEGVLRPVVVESISYLATTLAALVLFFDLLYFLLMRRLKRIGQPRKPKPVRLGTPPKRGAGGTPGGKPAPPPAVVEPAAPPSVPPAAAPPAVSPSTSPTSGDGEPIA